MRMYYLGEEILREKSEEVSVFDSDLKKLVDDMFALLKEKGGIGLAAPQIGVLKRVFITDTGNEGERRVFINPQIYKTSEDSVPFNEGCLSLPYVYFDVNRPSCVSIQAQDENGKIFKIDAKGIFARVIQHENDHLDGIVFIDHLSPEEKELACKKHKKHNKKILRELGITV